ncbi:unnamed protein product [Linum tenue]|nr:unnamed protein product [Linum tenue]
MSKALLRSVRLPRQHLSEPSSRGSLQRHGSQGGSRFQVQHPLCRYHQ